MIISKNNKGSAAEQDLLAMMSISKLARPVVFEILILVFSIFSCLLCISYGNAASATLAWNPNGEPDIAGYRLYYGKAVGSYESVVDVGNQTTYNLSDLEDGKAYYFVVTAYDKLGRESEFSSELRYPEAFSMTISLSTGLNLISLPLELLNPSISALTEQLSPCLVNVSSYVNDTYAWEFYDPAQLDQSTLATMEPGKGYWVEMACPGEVTVIGNRTANPITLIPGLNLVGYNSVTPLPVSEALSSIANRYTFVWGFKDDQWTFYDPADVAGSTLHILTPGSGYWIEAIEETAWRLPSVVTLPLVAGLNLISLPLEALNPSVSSLTEQLSPCLIQVLTYSKDAEGYDIWLYYDPSWPEQNTLSTLETGKGYWIDMACPGEITVVGNQTTNPIALIPGLNLVGYNSVTPLSVSEALSSIANQYTLVWGFKDDQWTFYDPADAAGSTLQVLTPGSGYWIEAKEDSIWTLPSAWTMAIPWTMTIPLSTGLNLISLPLELLNPSISALTEQLSPCLVNVSSYVNDTYAWEFYDPAQLDQSTLATMEPGKGYWVEMTCPGEMTVIGNRTANPITIIPGLNLVGYNSLKPLPASVALSSIANQYTLVWGFKDDQWTFYDPADAAGSTLQVLTPGSGYWIEAIEETTWVLP